jgi:hypothetical protein
LEDVMAKRDGGGPAFPLQDWDPVIQSRRIDTGMTLRDYFATKAMQGLLANGDGPTAPWFDDRGMAGVAAWAYIVADAMLAERAK